MKVNCPLPRLEIFCVSLRPPKKRAGDVDLQALKVMYGPSRSRLAGRYERILNRHRVVQKSDQIYFVLVRAQSRSTITPRNVFHEIAGSKTRSRP